MKLLLKTLSLAAASLFAAGSLHAQTGSIADGNWNTAGTWNNGVPVDNTGVGIINGNTVIFDSGTWIGNTSPQLQIGTTGDPWTGIVGSGAGTLNVIGNATITAGWIGLGVNPFDAPTAYQGILNISGNGTVNANDTFAVGWGGGVTPQINVSGGTLNLSGTGSVFALGFNFNGAAELNVSGTGDVNLSRSLAVQNAATIGVSGGTLDIDNSGSLNVTNGTVTVNGGAVSSGSAQDFLGNGAGTTGVMNISSGSFSKSGGNALVLGFAGGTGTVNQSGGTVALSTGEGLWLGNGAGGVGTYNLSGGTLTANGLVRFGVAGSGAGVFEQTGGTAELGAVTAWTGTTGIYNLKAGTLKALGNLGFDGVGANINLNISGASGNVTVDTNGFNVTAYNDSSFNNASSTLNKTGAGTLLITTDGASAGQLFIVNGALSVQNGTLETRASLVVGDFGGTASATISGGTLKTGYIAGGNFLVGAGGSTGTVTQSAGAVDIGSLANAAFGWAGTGTYTMNGGAYSAAATTYVGIFAGAVGTLNINGGTFTSASMEIAASGAASGTLNLGTGGSVGTLNTSVVNGGSGAVVNLNHTGNATFGQQFTGSLAMNKLGAGTSTLTASNTYTGDTTVTAGTLLINGSTSTGNVTVASGATLGGNGTIGGATTISGTHSPGNSSGLQTFVSDLSYGSTAVFVFELTSNSTASRGTAFDAVDVGGNLNITSGADFNITLDGLGSTTDFTDTFWTSNQSWLVMDVTGITTGNFAIGTITLDSLGQNYSAYGSFNTSVSGNDLHLNWVAVPEPSTWMLAAIGLAVTLRRRRRTA